MARLTNGIVDLRLFSKNIKRIDDYINSVTQITFECLKCNNQWKIAPGDVFREVGCPKCYYLSRFNTEEEFCAKILDTHVALVGKYIKASTKTQFLCKICQYSWETTPKLILSGSGCPKCAKAIPLNNDIVDERIKSKQVQRIGNCLNAKDNIEFLCLICNYSWMSRPAGVINSKHNCPSCAGTVPLNNQVIDERLINLPIRRIGNVGNALAKFKVECLQCKHIWETTPNRLFSAKSECPLCNKPGKLEKISKIFIKNTLNMKIEFEFPYKKIFTDLDRNYRADIFIPDLNTFIEIQGSQHYAPAQFYTLSKEEAEIKFQEQKVRDNKIRELCSKNNITLIEVDIRGKREKKLKIELQSILDNLKVNNAHSSSYC